MELNKRFIIAHDWGGGVETYIQQHYTSEDIYLRLGYNDETKLEIYLTYKDIRKDMIITSENDLSFLDYSEHIIINFLEDKSKILMKYLLKTKTPISYIIHDHHVIRIDPELDYHFNIYTLTEENIKIIKEEQKLRIENYDNLFKKCRNLITGSNKCKEIVNIFYPEISINVVPHEIVGIDYGLRFKKEKFLNIATIGATYKFKGSEIIEEYLSLIEDDYKIKISGFGDLGLSKSYKNIKRIQHYKDDEDLYTLLREDNIQIIWFPCVRHETFSYTLTKAMRSGLKIITSKTGSFPERLLEYHDYEIHDIYDGLSWKKVFDNHYIK